MDASGSLGAYAGRTSMYVVRTKPKAKTLNLGLKPNLSIFMTLNPLPYQPPLPLNIPKTLVPLRVILELEGA